MQFDQVESSESIGYVGYFVTQYFDYYTMCCTCVTYIIQYGQCVVICMCHKRSIYNVPVLPVLIDNVM